MVLMSDAHGDRSAIWMFLIFLAVSAVWVGAVLFGIIAAERQFAAETPETRLVRELRLPTGARDIIDLGNRWHVYTLAIDGRDHRFMCRRAFWGSGESEMVLEITADAKRP